MSSFDLVRAAADLERDFAGEPASAIESAISIAQRLALLSARQEIVVLKQENRDPAVAMQVDHLVDDRLAASASAAAARPAPRRRAECCRTSNPTDIPGCRESKPSASDGLRSRSTRGRATEGCRDPRPRGASGATLTASSAWRKAIPGKSRQSEPVPRQCSSLTSVTSPSNRTTESSPGMRVENLRRLETGVMAAHREVGRHASVCAAPRSPGRSREPCTERSARSRRRRACPGECASGSPRDRQP